MLPAFWTDEVPGSVLGTSLSRSLSLSLSLFLWLCDATLVHKMLLQVSHVLQLMMLSLRSQLDSVGHRSDMCSKFPLTPVLKRDIGSAVGFF